MTRPDPPAVKDMEWRPIETAPKDDTEYVRILLTDGRHVFIGYWSDEADYGSGEDTRPGWQIFTCDDSWYSEATENATHWMPLPEPPKE